MRSGELRHKLKILEPVESIVDGEVIQNWDEPASLFAEVWGAVLPLIGREYWSARQVNAEISGKVRIRYLSGVTAKMKIKFGTRMLDIKAVINVEEKNCEMVLLTSEAV